MDFENNNIPTENTENEVISNEETQITPEIEVCEAENTKPSDDGLTVTFDTVTKPVEHTSNTGVKVFFSMIAVVVALIIAVSAGYVLGNNQLNTGNNKTHGLTSTAGKNEADHQYNITTVYNNVNPSVVGISVYTGNTLMGYASGVIYTEDGYIVTNDHIYAEVASPKFLVTMYDGSIYDAEFIAGDTRSDLAVLKINATGLKKATFGNHSEVISGEEVIAIGYPTGVSSQSVLTSGTISSPAVRFTGSSSYSTKMIQTDAPINPGNSGGALVNMYSQVIGIPSVKLAGTSYDNIGYAIPSDTVVMVADSLIKHGYVAGRGRLGITYTEINAVMGKISGSPTGLKIVSISDDSDLYGKGIKVNDIITHINNVEITSSDVALDIIEKTAPGVPLNFTVYHEQTKTSSSIYASLLPDQGNSSYKIQFTDESTGNPFGDGIDDFFSDH